jgi:hypothetical protein
MTSLLDVCGGGEGGEESACESKQRVSLRNRAEDQVFANFRRKVTQRFFAGAYPGGAKA